MKIAAHRRWTGEGGELLKGRDDVSEDNTEDGELWEMGLGDGEPVDYAGSAVVAYENDSSGGAVGCMKRFDYCVAVYELVVACFGGSGVPVTRELRECE